MRCSTPPHTNAARGLLYLIYGRYFVMSVENLLHQPLQNINCNCKIKHYPSGQMRVSVYSADIVRAPGWEAQQPRQRREADPDKGQVGSVDRAKRRAKAALYDIAMSNEFKYFVTLTLDSSKINRYDMKEITRRVNYWLDNGVRRHGLQYVLVPELHRDGAVHYHGFFNDALPVVDSGTLSTGQGKPRKPRSMAQRQMWLDDGAHIVYNIPKWNLGFSTAIELYGDYRAAVGYVGKYITKTADKVGGRWYYSGGALRRPEESYHLLDFGAVAAEHPELKPYRIDALGCYGLTFDLG